MQMSSLSQLSSQSLSSPAPSSLQSSILCQQRLTNKDRRRLDDIYRRLSKHIIDRRSIKIELLEKYDIVLSDKEEIQREIRKIEAVQAKKIAKEHEEQKRKMFDLLVKKEQMQENLIDMIEMQKKEKGNDAQLHRQNKTELQNMLQKDNQKLEEELKVLEKQYQKLVVQTEGPSGDEASMKSSGMRSRRRGKMTKSQQIRLAKHMSCSQIEEYLPKLKNKSQRQEISQLLSKVQYTECSLEELQAYVEGQQNEKQKLFQDLMAMKAGLSKLRRENSALQVFLVAQLKKESSDKILVLE